MTLHALQALTWGTVTSAVVSALLLAAGESAWLELSRSRDGVAQPPASEPVATERKKAPARAERARKAPPAQVAAVR
jgi:hypothetical protein